MKSLKLIKFIIQRRGRTHSGQPYCMPSLSQSQAKEQAPGKDLEWTVIVKLNREMVVGGTTVIKGRKCVDIKGRKSRRDD